MSFATGPPPRHCDNVGSDGVKKIKARKRHLLLGTMGLVLAVMVTPADLTERAGGVGVFTRLGYLFFGGSNDCGSTAATRARTLPRT